MEKEEIKENNSCDKKESCCGSHKSSHCCMMKKCHMMKMLGFLIIIATAFCFGSFFGRMHARYEGGRYLDHKNYKMMDGWTSHKEGPGANTSSKQVTIDVKDSQ